MAAGLAILLILELTEYTIIERSVKGTGFDYWLIERNTYEKSDQVFPKGTARLEVSGILQSRSDTEMRTLLKKKFKQVSVSDQWSLPSVIIVLEFGRPEVQIARKS
jgi:hypothetical protein